MIFASLSQLVEILKKRPDVGVVDEEHSWRIHVSKGPFLVTVTVPHDVFEWFVHAKDRKSGQEVWSDWIDYEGYDNTSKIELESEMAGDVYKFVDQVSKRPLTFPVLISTIIKDFEREDSSFV